MPESLESMLWSSSSCQVESSSFKFPPGFRFHPTDEELVHHYLKKKVECKRMDIDIIQEIDLYKLEPWDLQDKCRIKGVCSEEDENGWYFFCQKGRKYPTGSRTNRATCSGFWKATGRDKPIYTTTHDVIMGMRKTLVFYKGRAPHGHKTDWIMHEYRLQNCSLEEGWVVCKVFRKSCPLTRKGERESSTSLCLYNGIYPHIGMLGEDLNLPQTMSYPMMSCHSKHTIPIEMPYLESPKTSSNTYASLGLNMPRSSSSAIKGIKGIFLGMETHFSNFEKVKSQTTLLPHMIDPSHHQQHISLDTMQHNVTDWRVLDRLVASQLSPNDTSSPIDTNTIHNCYGNVREHNGDIDGNNGGGGGDDDVDKIIDDLSSAKSSD